MTFSIVLSLLVGSSSSQAAKINRQPRGKRVDKSAQQHRAQHKVATSSGSRFGAQVTNRRTQQELVIPTPTMVANLGRVEKALSSRGIVLSGAAHFIVLEQHAKQKGLEVKRMVVERQDEPSINYPLGRQPMKAILDAAQSGDILYIDNTDAPPRVHELLVDLAGAKETFLGMAVHPDFRIVVTKDPGKETSYSRTGAIKSWSEVMTKKEASKHVALLAEQHGHNAHRLLARIVRVHEEMATGKRGGSASHRNDRLARDIARSVESFGKNSETSRLNLATLKNHLRAEFVAKGLTRKQKAMLDKLLEDGGDDAIDERMASSDTLAEMLKYLK